VRALENQLSTGATPEEVAALEAQLITVRLEVEAAAEGRIDAAVAAATAAKLDASLIKVAGAAREEAVRVLTQQVGSPLCSRLF
jgi:hypothetical protein